ncbi:conjugal transfer protein [Streptomyces parvus]|uniref:conjugal transfer protein n=1 Tax=Streptomyces parvus TaxID=66428 RepID=UPI0033ECB26F
MPLGPNARRILGLPEPGAWQKKRERDREKRRTKDGPPRETPAANPWEEAARQLKAPAPEQPAQAPAGPTPAAPVPPWSPLEERPGATAARSTGRALLWGTVGLFALLGVKAVVWPGGGADDGKGAAQPGPARTAPAYPVADAQALAARFTHAYLAWDEDAPQVRAAALAAVLPPDTAPALGWDGKGRQTVLAVQPGPVTRAAHRAARVRVEALVKPDTAPARWVGLDVPVAQTASTGSARLAVTGPPGLVGLPATGPRLPDLPTPEADNKLSERTEDTIRSFFAAYADGGDTETITAPGASVPPLPEGLELVSVVSWTADAGSGETRTGTARVSWSTGGARIEQTYRVGLTRVASASAQRWQVSAVSGGDTPTP